MFAQWQFELEIDGEAHNIGISLAPDASGALCVTNANENSVTRFDYYAREVIALYASEPFDKSPGSIRGPCRCVLQDAHTLLLAEFGNRGARIVDLGSGTTVAEWKVGAVSGESAFAVAMHKHIVVIGTRVPVNVPDEDDELAPELRNTKTKTPVTASMLAAGATAADCTTDNVAETSTGTLTTTATCPALPTPQRSALHPTECSDVAVLPEPPACASGCGSDRIINLSDAVSAAGSDKDSTCVSPPSSAQCARLFMFDATASSTSPLCTLTIANTCAIIDTVFIHDTDTLLVLPLGTNTLEVLQVPSTLHADDGAPSSAIVTAQRTLSLCYNSKHLSALCVLDAFPSVVFVADQSGDCVCAFALDTGALLFKQHVLQPVGLTVEQPDTLLVLGANPSQSLITTFKVCNNTQSSDEHHAVTNELKNE